MPGMVKLDGLFGSDGALSRLLPHYQPRPGQIEMARAVQQALEQEEVLICEAGTGTGKTLAYLLPAALSGKRVVISTATRALQDQIKEHDLPLVGKVLGQSPVSVVMKGLGNYLCLRRYDDWQARAPEPLLARRLPLIERWRQQTQRGDLSEIDAIPEDDPWLSEVQSSSETRVGSQCRYHDSCFVTRMKREAEQASLIIVNHHLFFADLALRGPHPGRVLPDYDAVIFDEAHQIEDIATRFFGVRITRRRFRLLAEDARRTLSAAQTPNPDNLANQLERLHEDFFAALRELGSGQDGRIRLEVDSWNGSPQRVYLELDSVLDGLAHAFDAARLQRDTSDSARNELEALTRRVAQLRDGLAVVVDGAPGRITWYERQGSGEAVASSPVEVSRTLRDRLFEQTPCVVLTSATLTSSARSLRPGDGSASRFAFIRSRVGLDADERSVEELVVPSPFDFRNHTLLYLPKSVPDPRDHGFIAAVTPEMTALIEAADGGAFVLTTSLRTMQLLHRQLGAALAPRPVLLQGQASKRSLLQRFKATRRAVLVATLGFWEGVDVPGEALRLVILEKIPFSPPNDPLTQARARLLEDNGHSPFNDLFIPHAQLTLKQGFGRLIRTERDVGVVALFDSRVHTRGYGQRLLQELPPARRTTQLGDALAFLERHRPAVSAD